MLTQAQLIQQLEEDPSDSNIAIAIDWIKGRSPRGKAARAVLLKLMGIEHAGAKLADLTPWMRTAIWDYFELSRELVSIDHLDWLLSLLKQYPQHKQAALLWQYLLGDYENPEIISGASDWLLQHGRKDDRASGVAPSVLREISSPEIVALSKDLLAQNSGEFLLANEILKRDPDDTTIDIAIEILNGEEPLIGCCVVPGLIESGERGVRAVKDFLDHYRGSKKYSRILSELAEMAPEFALPYVRDWLKEHPKSKESERILFETVISGVHLPEYKDMFWSWTRENSPKSDIMHVLIVLSLQNSAPEDVLNQLCDLLESNEDREIWSKAFVKKFRDSSLENLYQMLEEWKAEMPDDSSLSAIVTYLERAAQSDQDEEQILAETAKILGDVNPALAEFKFELSKRSSERQEPKACKYALCEGVYNGDSFSIQKAKDWLSKRRILKRWSSLHEYRGELIAALLTVAPDESIVKEAVRWLERYPQPYERELYFRVKKVYEENVLA